MQNKSYGSFSAFLPYDMHNYIPFFSNCQYINKNFFVFLFFPEVAADGFCIIFIVFSERFTQKRFFDNDRLQMQHYRRKKGKNQKERIEKHQKNPEIKKVETEKRGVAADRKNPRCDNCRLLFFGNSDTPAVPHCHNRRNKDGNARRGDEKPDYPQKQRKNGRSDNNACNFGYNDEKSRNGHQIFYRSGFFRFAFAYLRGFYPFFSLPEHLYKVAGIKNGEQNKCGNFENHKVSLKCCRVWAA